MLPRSNSTGRYARNKKSGRNGSPASSPNRRQLTATVWGSSSVLSRRRRGGLAQRGRGREVLARSCAGSSRRTNRRRRRRARSPSGACGRRGRGPVHCEGHHRCNDVDLIKSHGCEEVNGGRRTCTAVDVLLVTDLYRLEPRGNGTRCLHSLCEFGCWCSRSPKRDSCSAVIVHRADPQVRVRRPLADRRNRFNKMADPR